VEINSGCELIVRRSEQASVHRRVNFQLSYPHIGHWTLDRVKYCKGKKGATMTAKTKAASQERRVRIGISSCLLGEKVRYDGGHKLDRFLVDTLGRYVEYVPVCPEVECGLPVPRESMHLAGEPQNPRLVTTKTGVDLTERMAGWAAKRVKELESENLSGFIFKSGSPSSGMERVKVFDGQGRLSGRGAGMFAAAFMKHFPLIPAEDDGRLHDPVLRENFIEAIFTCARWRDLAGGEKSLGGLVSFHTAHKLLILSHSRKYYDEMGRLVAEGKKHPSSVLFSRYGTLLMNALKVKTTGKKNTDVLMHAMGYFKKTLSSDEKRELLETIENYRAELVPFVVPLTLIRHYIRKYDQPYLGGQLFFNPNPLEVMLRNHV
jgi:uncharacterized protein YbgA (DUF1722 family)/uncharacterized protein YbbK (DUF523 family)